MLTVCLVRRKHLERHHRSYECYSGLEDYHDSNGIFSHPRRGCTPAVCPPYGIPHFQLQNVKNVLDPDIADDSIISDEERWNRMWDIVFPTLRNRPNPCLFTSPILPGNKQPAYIFFCVKILTCLWWPQTLTLTAASYGFR